MTSTLLIQVAGPMQSWGVQSRFTIRDSGLEPSKSGVVGLLAAALGRDRGEPIDDLAGLAMGVRVDQEGKLSRDFHTAGRDGFLRASGKIERKDVIVSERFFLADAAFLVGLESSDEALLERIDAALRNPVWPLFLGRKSFVPGIPVHRDEGIQKGQVVEILRKTPLIKDKMNSDEPIMVRFVIDEGAAIAHKDDALERKTIPDFPLHFSPRKFAPRSVLVFQWPVPSGKGN